MTFNKLFLRFGLVFVSLSIFMPFLLVSIGIPPAGWLNIVILVASLYWACLSFFKANNRCFTKVEKNRVVIVFAMINIMLQSTGFLISLALMESVNASFGAILGSYFLLIAIHTLAIYFLVGSVNKGAMIKYQKASTDHSNNT